MVTVPQAHNKGMSLAENENVTGSWTRPYQRECMTISFHYENKLFPNTFVNSKISSGEVMELYENKRKGAPTKVWRRKCGCFWSMKHEFSQEVRSMILPYISFKIIFGLVFYLKSQLWVNLFGETINKRPHIHVWVSSGKNELLLGIIESGLG